MYVIEVALGLPGLVPKYVELLYLAFLPSPGVAPAAFADAF
jgi:hypothetical protein